MRRNAPAFHDQTDRIADLLDTYAKLTGAMCAMAKKGMSAQALTLAHRKVDPLQKTLFADLDTFADDLSTVDPHGLRGAERGHPRDPGLGRSACRRPASPPASSSASWS